MLPAKPCFSKSSRAASIPRARAVASADELAAEPTESAVRSGRRESMAEVSYELGQYTNPRSSRPDGRPMIARCFADLPRERRLLREIERFTGQPIQPMRLPSQADVAARRVALFK